MYIYIYRSWRDVLLQKGDCFWAGTNSIQTIRDLCDSKRPVCSFMVCMKQIMGIIHLDLVDVL